MDENSTCLKSKLTVIGCICLNLFLGCFYLWSNIAVYVVSYMYQFDKTLSYDSIFYVDTANKILLNLGYFIGLYLMNTKGIHPKIVIAGGSLMAVVGIFASSFTHNF